VRIAVSAAGKEHDSEVDPRFGRCGYFLVVDSDTREFEAFANESVAAMGGAGIKAAQFVVGLDVGAVLTSNIGPNAFEVLDAAGIEVMTCSEGTVEAAIESYNAGELQKVQGSTVESHFGMGQGGRRGR